MAWVDFPATGLEADAPLHAGVTIDWWRNNTEWALNYGGYDFQALVNDGAGSIIDYTYTPVVINTWYLFDTWGPIPIPIRPAWYGSFWRSVYVGFQGKTSAIGNCTVRFYLMPEYLRPSEIVVDGTDALWDPSYGEVVFNNSAAYEYKEDSVDPPNFLGIMPEPQDDFGLPDRHPCAWIYLVVKVSAAMTINLRGPRIREE